jgi:hypothetical protein
MYRFIEGLSCPEASRIHERTKSLRFLGIIVRVYYVYITNQFQTTFARGGGGDLNPLVVVTVNSKEETS